MATASQLIHMFWTYLLHVCRFILNNSLIPFHSFKQPWGME